MLCVARAGITVLVISVAVVRPAAVALLLLSGSCCACSAGYGRTAQLLQPCARPGAWLLQGLLPEPSFSAPGVAAVARCALPLGFARSSVWLWRRGGCLCTPSEQRCFQGEGERKACVGFPMYCMGSGATLYLSSVEHTGFHRRITEARATRVCKPTTLYCTGRDVEAGARSAPPTAPVAEASAAPKEPLPLRVLIIHPDDEVVCGMEVAGTDSATARGASADATASNKTEGVAARDGGAVSAAPRAGAAAVDAPAASSPAGSGRHSDSRLSGAEGERGAAAADGALVAPASAVRAGPSHSSAPSQSS